MFFKFLTCTSNFIQTFKTDNLKFIHLIDHITFDFFLSSLNFASMENVIRNTM